MKRKKRIKILKGLHIGKRLIKWSKKREYYRESIPLDQISHVQLIEATPKIKLRTNGIAIGEIKKGYFSTDTLGNIKLIVHKDKKPFLHIETENKRHIIINFRDPNKTLDIYNSIMLHHKQ